MHEKKAKENWVEEQYSEVGENRRKNKGKGQGIQTRERLDHCETRECDNCPRSFRKMPHRRAILNRWAEYCSELYNHKANGDPSVLNCTQTDTEDDHPILRREVEAAV